MSRDLSLYQSPRRFAARRKRYYARREKRAKGSYILGRFCVSPEGVFFIEAVAEQPGFWIDKAAPLTTNSRQFYRWSTRQSARQYHIFNLQRLPPVMLINLARTVFRERPT